MSTSNATDAVVVGGGIAGASVAAFLAADGVNTILIERENSLAYHTTGRSAALLTPSYGPLSIRAFGHVGRDFLEDPPIETNSALITPRELISVVGRDEVMQIERPPKSIWLDESELRERVPFLRPQKFIGAIVDTQVATIDVHALHSLYINIFTRHGGKVMLDCAATEIKNLTNRKWQIKTPKETLTSSFVINAAGAWGDAVAQIAGISPVGLIPKRRTVVVIGADQFEGVDFGNLPFVVIEPEYVYFQPFGVGQLMISPADQTPSQACDAQPNELDIAIAVSRFEQATSLKVRNIDHSWAGLRTFTSDNHPVIGWESQHPGFFWLTGQGGYGIFTSTGIGRYAACLISGSQLPDAYLETKYPFETLSPDRFRLGL